MKAFKYILFLLLIAIIGTSIYIAVQPNSFIVTRTRTIKAPVSVIYNNVVDLKNWGSWSPWIEKDPTTIITLSEQTKGVNGTYSWTNKEGTGSIKTTEITANKSIKQNMQFAEFPASEIAWNFTPNTDGTTTVTWNISSENLPFGFKAYTAFFGSMEEHVGSDFERGLEKLDRVIINSMKVYSIKIDGITEYGGGFFIYKSTSVAASNISKIMTKQYADILSYMAKNNIVANGNPFTIYNEINPENGNVIMSNAIPVMNKIDFTNFTENNDILCGYTPKTKVLKATLKGNYSNLPEAWKTTMNHISQNNLIQSDLKPFEIYTNNPENVPNPANWITEIYIPLKD
ncbi:SRPBCC family protein [Thalassobellus suaedae]|uniref:SRPBCC family protein n=1 Tax=Thalassobellus suaedae TaxID=3074124 RepID=A0ABY9Y3W8_9FLAO|nr:SRPBCC family protein [Flavobacteriaceae bacterium HL-DH10]